MTAKTELIAPFGEALVDLTAPDGVIKQLKAHASTLDSIRIDERQLCDLEVLTVGGFAPLDHSVCISSSR